MPLNRLGLEDIVMYAHRMSSACIEGISYMKKCTASRYEDLC